MTALFCLADSSEIWTFLGKFHPLVLHLPIGALAMVLLAEIWSLRSKEALPDRLRSWLGGFLAISAVAAALLGLMLGSSGEFSGRSYEWHKWSGIGFAVACAVIWFFRRMPKLYLSGLLTLGALMSLVGHLGGSLTHGEGYLTKNLPEWMPAADFLKRLDRMDFGGAAEASSVSVDGSAASEVMSILEQRCYECHGASKQNGGLRMDRYEDLMRGGDSGPALVVNNAPESLLYQRVVLPHEHDEFMPPKGDPLSNEQVAKLRDWINSGAVAAASDTEGPASLAPAKPETLGGFTPQELEELANATKALVLPMASLPSEPGYGHLRIDFSRHPERYSPEALTHLAPYADRILELSFARTEITGAQLADLAAMANLQKLHLERSKVGDEGFIDFAARYPELTYLNLSSTDVGDATLRELGGNEELEKLYLFETKVSAGALRAFLETRMTLVPPEG